MVVSRHEAKTFTLYLKEYVMFRSRLGLTGHVLLISGALVCMLLISRETVLTTDEMLSLRGGNTCYKLETVPCFPTRVHRFLSSARIYVDRLSRIGIRS
jgi:hypothetical protein